MTRRAVRAAGLLIALSGLLSLAVPGWGAGSGDAGGPYVLAVLRVVVGVLLIEAAAKSRMPRTLRVIGIAAVLVGLVTPLLGSDRARAVLQGWIGAPPTVTRVWAGLMLIVGAIIVYAVGGEPPRRRALPTR
jgi:hypothetical protein